MSCDRFEEWVVSDDPAERQQAERHAAACERCAAILTGQIELRRQVEEWAVAQEPPERLQSEVRAAVGQALAEGDVVAFSGHAASRKWRPVVLWGSLAASLVIGAGLAFVGFGAGEAVPESAERLLVAEALSDVETAERQHARAIEQLERAAAPVLAAAADPQTPPQRAAKLFAFRDRLAFLDATIDDVHGFIQDNPGNAGARSLLLSAYQEKTDVLREVLALEERS